MKTSRLMTIRFNSWQFISIYALSCKDLYYLVDTIKAHSLVRVRISPEHEILMNGPIEGTPTVLQKHTHIHKTNNLIWRRKNGLLHQSDPSKQLCFIFDLIVSPLTATFINSSNGQSEVGRVSALILSPSPPLHSQYDRLVLYFIKMLLPNGRAEVEGRREEGNKGDWEASHFRGVRERKNQAFMPLMSGWRQIRKQTESLFFFSL